MTPLNAKDFVEVCHKPPNLEDKKDIERWIGDIHNDPKARGCLESILVTAVVQLLIKDPKVIVCSILFAGILLGRELEQKQKEVEDLNKLYSK